MGLETDQRLKTAAVEAILKYGIQYPSSRAYVSNTLYSRLEELVEKMFNAPIVLASSLSIGHHGIMPVILEEGDVIIMDQQVHSSVQDAARKMQLQGIHLTIIRHNNLDELKKKIQEFSTLYKRIWYMCDGIYSMYGDAAPIGPLIELLDKHKQFHLYIDDAHGMSSYGKNGTGYVLSQTVLHPKMILCTGMAKGFGTIGAIFVIPNKELALKVRNCSGPLIFSGQQATSILAASIASAEIHLSGEIDVRQKFLAEKIAYCHKLLKEYNLPDISDPHSPIFFIGLGMMNVGFNMVKRMINEGFYVNIAAFPAVPETCTGIRFTITLHLTLEDIEQLVITIAKHLPLALAEEGRSIKDIQRAFRKIKNLDYINKITENSLPNKPNFHNYKIIHQTSILQVSQALWDSLLGHRGVFSWKNLLQMEKIFTNNELPENNWKFHYYIITDENNKPLLATFLTITLTKNDMLSPSAVSEQIQKQRQENKYYMTCKAMMMGAFTTEGDHLYVDYNHADWKKVLVLFLDQLFEEYEKEEAEILFLRDIPEKNIALNEIFISHGFIKTFLPDSFVVSDLNWSDKESFLSQFSKHRRKYLKKEVFGKEDLFEVQIFSGSIEYNSRWYELYSNVQSSSLEISTFKLPELFFKNICLNEDWEVIQLTLKPSPKTDKNEQIAAVMFCYKNITSYNPLFVGLDYDFIEQGVYPQILWQTILRAKELKKEKVPMGFTAGQNKRKFGAEPISQVGFIQMKDSYQMHLLGLVPHEGTRKTTEHQNQVS